ncbi:preprotein translocase subunit SecE [Candidatus Marinamargulisbacteria bacterium SCGC AG-414-C22]|nr:preprotein translocase subunit SecE [Candidatus Marinamargulisbacteria bacterium SCGC AG-414-C22]
MKSAVKKRDKSSNTKSTAARQGKPSFSTNPSIELKRVTWPTNEKLVKSTILILVIILISTLYIMGLDLLFSNAFEKIKAFFA